MHYILLLVKIIMERKNKTYNTINERYHGITRSEVTELLQHYQLCARNKPSQSRGPLQPIVVNNLWERVQIDLIDMRADPDGEYHWILHIRDHFSKYSSAYPLKSKESTEVANILMMWIGQFGPPRILQCDNGFKGEVLVIIEYHGITLIRGCPRHPQTQGLIEQANTVLKQKIRMPKAKSGDNRWVQILPIVILAMNQQIHSTTGYSPYEVVFKQKVHYLSGRLSPILDANNEEVEDEQEEDEQEEDE